VQWNNGQLCVVVFLSSPFRHVPPLWPLTPPPQNPTTLTHKPAT
jgi:hypothetical protein